MEPKTTAEKATEKYWQAYEQWKKLDIKLGASASERFTREEAHDRPVCRERD